MTVFRREREREREERKRREKREREKHAIFLMTKFFFPCNPKS